MHTDCDLKPLRKEMNSLGINLNCAFKKEDVLEIEHFIRAFKERFRSNRSTMPFKRISKLMIVHLVASDIVLLNVFPPSTPGAGMSDTKGPKKLFFGNSVNYKKGSPPPSRRICPGASR